MDNLLNQLGIDSVLREHWTEVRAAVRYPEILLLGLILLPAAAWLVWRRHAMSLATLPPITRHTLTVLRLGVLTAVIVILAGPFLSLDIEIAKRPVLALVLDQTRSMDLPFGAAADDKSARGLLEAMGRPAAADQASESAARAELENRRRVEIAQEVIEKTHPHLWQPLTERFDVRVLALREELASLAKDPRESELQLPPPPPTGAGRTRLGNAISQLVEESAGKPMAGIVLLSDGQNTGGVSVTQAAFAARRAKAPVFTVPVGNAARLKDVAIVDVFSPGVVSKDDTPRISVTLQSHGYDEQSAEVVLREGRQIIERKPLRLNGREQQHLDFAYKATTNGLHVLAVEVDVKPGEAIKVNNRDRVALWVTDEKLKVLLVEGQPRWDFRFLRNAMERDPGLKVDNILETEPRRGPTAPTLPTKAADYTEYAAVVLGDVSPKLLTPECQKALLEAVRDHGLGLVLAAGPRQMPHAYRTQPLEPLVPVVYENAPGRLAPGYEAYRLDLTPAGRTHEVTRLYEDPNRNETVWNELPPFYWCGAAQRVKPGAAALVVNRGEKNEFGPVPIVVSQQAGDGVVLYIGTDSTWEWRQNVGDRYFYKFWGQAVRFVARRPNAGKDHSKLEVNPLQVAPGEEVTLALKTPVQSESVEVRLERTGDVESGRTDPVGAGVAKTVSLTRDPDVLTAPFHYIGKARIAEEGRFVATFDSPGGPAAAEFAVLDGIEEFQRPEVNRDALEAIARNSGGRLVELHELEQIPPLLEGETSFRQLRRQQELWDKWFAVVLVASLYCVDVGIRRWLGLA